MLELVSPAKVAAAALGREYVSSSSSSSTPLEI
jgi:hypothetical protein